MTTPIDNNEFCAILSEQAAEPLAGTALVSETYLLLEYHGHLGKEALDESDLPVEVKAYFSSQIKILPNARLQLMHGPHRPYEAGPLFFLVRTQDRNPAIYRFQLNSVLDVLGLDLAAIQRGDPAWNSHLSPEPLYLVCTHGRRDPCCAKFGLPVYRELSEILEGRLTLKSSVWQSSHVGGHRFAPNLLILPHGLMYGRLGTQTAREVAEAYQRGEIELEYLRGRTAYPQPAQAAEILLRRETGQVRVDAFQLVSAQEETPGVWEVIFLKSKSSEKYGLTIRVEKTNQGIFESCQSDKQTLMTRHHLEHFELLA
jgi:hypothetical protein